MGGMQGTLAVVFALMNKVFGDKIAAGIRETTLLIKDNSSAVQKQAIDLQTQAAAQAKLLAVEKESASDEQKVVLDLKIKEAELQGKAAEM
jgi:hypothetical protein